jgi:CRP/FNR family cyclic AMP-dependent transcriptional regulator
MNKSSLNALEKIGADQVTSAEICAMLDGAQMLRDFEWLQIEALSAYVQLYRASPGSVLFSEGDQGDFMCIVLKGRVDIRKQDIKCADKSVATVQAGRSFGEMALVDGEVRSATALVKDEALLAVLTKDSFMSIRRDKPSLAIDLLIKFAQTLSQRLRQTSGVLVDYLEK